VNYLRAENVSKAYGDRVLFNGLTLSIEQGQKIALIARNGSGKTTLLNILGGRDTTNSGSLVVSKDISMAFLEQEPPLDKSLSVWETLFSGNNPVLKAVSQYELALERQEHDHSEASMGQLQEAMEAMDRLNAWDYEARVKQILTRLNIHHTDQKVGSLSGGQRKRLALAGILIHNPDFIIMDEPTNHLDVDMIEWLEGYLKSQDTTLLIVTHDRYFLDKVCTEILELDNGQLYRYMGNYAYYVEKKADREMREEREVDKARNLLRKELEWMRRQPKARGTKSKSRIEAFYELKDKAAGRTGEKQVELDIRMQRMGGKILELHHVKKAFGDLPIVNDFSYLFRPGERIGIVGRNGVGKSTFLNMLQGLEKPDAGRITTGDTIIYGYYSQTGILLGDDKRVIEVVQDIAEYIELNRGEKLTAQQLLRRFLFDDKQQFTFVSKLSGGEKRRLYLLTILMKNPNFLILDEPTNDLDIPTLNVLENFLESFKGCIIIVTHDRYFMDRIVDHLFIFEGEGEILDFNGNYQDYLDEKEEEARRALEPKPKPVHAATVIAPETGKRKATFKEQREYEALTAEIAELDARRLELESILSSGITDHEEIARHASELESTRQHLGEKEMRWLELGEVIG
jgi:ATP-binding cassette subfamily F protein uup